MLGHGLHRDELGERTTVSTTGSHGDTQPDTEVEQIREALAAYRRIHPRAAVDVRRRNPAAIHVRIIDEDFRGKDRVDREPEVWRILEGLPDDAFTSISMLILLTPEEAPKSFANMEFEDPLPSPL